MAGDKVNALNTALRALQCGLGYTLTEVKEGRKLGDGVGRAKRIFVRYLLDAGFSRVEISEIIETTPQKVYNCLAKKADERKDEYRRAISLFEASIRRQRQAES